MANIVKKIKAGTVHKDLSEFVGDEGTIFYDFYSGTMRIGDGVTPGGQPINLIGTFNDIAISNLIINGTTISPADPNANLSLSASGTGVVHITSPLSVHQGNLSGNIVFNVDSTGETELYFDATTQDLSAINIIADPSRIASPTNRDGVLIHTTGSPNIPNRILHDGNNEYATYVVRRFNGTTIAPTQVLADQTIGRFAASPYTSAGWLAQTTARIQFVANENQTGSAQGSRIEFWNTRNGTTSVEKVADITGNIFNVTNFTTSGQVDIIQPVQNPNRYSVLNVIGSSTGDVQLPNNPGAMVHVTGHDGIVSRIINDSYGNLSTISASFVGRHARGTAAQPSRTLANDAIWRLVGSGYGDTKFADVATAAIESYSAEDCTDTTAGTYIKIKTTPIGSLTYTDSVIVDQTGVKILDGTRFQGKIILPAGTADVPPIQFTAGVLTTTPTPGAFGYNGTSFYATPQEGERGLVAAEQVYVLQSTLNLTAGTIALQNLFGVGVNLSANTRYYYQIRTKITKNGSASNTPTINFALGGTATLFAHSYNVTSVVSATDAAVGAAYAMWNTINTGFNVGVPITPALPINVGYAVITITGIIDTNTTGTVIPQIAFSAAPNTSCAVLPFSKMCIHSFGQPGTNTVIGTWV